MTGAEALVAALAGAGVEVVFGLPGVHNLAAWEALRRSPIRLVGVRHEQAAAYAADGYARASGRVGVALVTTGPGAANTLAATGEAWASGSPVLVIATDVPAGARREGVVRGSLHEASDQRALFAPVTKRTARAADAVDVGVRVRRMVAHALAAPRRPVFLEIPTDLLDARLEGDVPDPAAQPPGLGAPDVDHAVSLLRAAKRPLVWAGGGAVDAAAEVGALAERLGAPVLTTYSARGLLGDHPLAVGLPPHVPEAGALWDAADVVVAVGSDLDAMNTQGWRQPAPAHLVAVNVDPIDAAKNYRAEVVEAEAAVGCRALAAGAFERDPWADPAAVRSAALGRLRAEHPEEVAFLGAFAEAVPPEAVVVCDMCIPGYWLAALHRVPAARRLQYPMGWGTLGYAFPAAVGTALAHDGPTVAVCGDGGFLFACGELATVAQERPRLTTVIVDDGGYGMLRFDQRRKGLEPFGVDLTTPDHVALARAFGLRAEAVDGLGDAFGARLAAHLADPAPSVLAARAALAPPPTTSPRWYRAPG